jgi:hypothetical protein
MDCFASLAMTNVSFRLRPIGTTGKITKSLSTPSHKNIPLNLSGKSVLFLRVSHPIEGRVAIVSNVR